MHARTPNLLSCILSSFISLLILSPATMIAQEAPKPTAKAVPSADSPARWDFFAGYSYLAPKATVVSENSNHQFVPSSFKASSAGLIFSGARYFNNYLGAQLEGSTHDTFTNSAGSNSGFMILQTGLIARFPFDEITPFVHGLVGGAYVGGPMHQPYRWGPALTIGGGMDYETPFFNHRLAIRLFQADFQYIHENWGPAHRNDAGEWIYGGRGNINTARLSTGLVFHVGSISPPPQLTVACSANPTSVFPGDPVNLTASVGSSDPKLNLIYGWSGDGVKGDGAHATMDTSNLTAGAHTIKCDAKEGKPGKEGLKPWEVATQGSTTFTVKEFEPPTISCSANPTTIKPGDSSTITCQATSPQNRPLTYTYTASSGTVNGAGNTATFSSTGAPTGPVSITGNVADDKAHSASSNAMLTIEAPPTPPLPHTQALCSINFSNDKKRPSRVDNEAKACLDEVALDLQKRTDAKAVIVGESTAIEKAVQEKAEKLNAKRKHPKDVENTAAQRAVNTREYLVTDKGVDPSRISVATGSGDEQKVENYLVPAGATFSSDVQGTSPVDESAVKPQVRKPLPMRQHKHASTKSHASLEKPASLRRHASSSMRSGLKKHASLKKRAKK